MPENLSLLLRRLVRWAFLPAVVLVVWGELKPHLNVHPPWDKALHFIAYSGLAGMATLALGRTRAAIWAAVALAAFGGILEIVQGYVGRDSEWDDEFANVVGVCVGLAAGLLILRAMARLSGGGSTPGGSGR
jgi:VanZ family protein